jgi:hypothetical protein
LANGGKKRLIEAKNEEKKIRMRKEESVEHIGKRLSFYKKKSEIKSACFSNMPMILLMYKNTYFNTNNLDSFIFSVAISLLQKFEDCIGQSNLDFSLICPTT